MSHYAGLLMPGRDTPTSLREYHTKTRPGLYRAYTETLNVFRTRVTGGEPDGMVMV